MRLFVKRAKFDKDFVRERLDKMVIEENIKGYIALKDKKDDIGDKGVAMIRKRLDSNTSSAFRSVDATYKDYTRYIKLIGELKARQRRRRRKLFVWFKDYVTYLENDEYSRMVTKYNVNLQVPGLDNLVTEEYSEEETLFLDDLISAKNKQGAEKIQAPAVAVEPEKAKQEEKPEKVEGPAEQSLSASSEARKEEKQGEKIKQEEKEKKSGEDKNSSKEKAEKFLKNQ